MSADSEPPAAPEPKPPAPEDANLPAAEEGNAPEYLPQKRRHRKVEPATELELTEGEDDEILILGTLLQRLLARKQAESVEPESRTRINRFVQKNTVPLGTPSASADTSAQEAGPAAAASASTDTGRAATPALPGALPKLTPRLTAPPDDTYWTAPSRGRSVLFFVFSAGLAIAAFLVGRGAAPHPEASQHTTATAASAPPPRWNATLLGKLDQVLATDQTGDLKKAKDEALDLKKQLGSSLELDVYLGSLTTRLGHTNDAEADLSRLLEPYMQPLPAAAVNEGMGFTYSRRRDFKRAAEAFADASRIDPFNPDNYYRWGEVLRRQGRLQDAIDKFRQALQRLPEGAPESESQRECAGLKMRLAQIELGRDADVKPDLDAHLREPAPGGYWLLTAAAFALQHNDIPGATDALQKARAALPAGQYSALLDDYYFHTYALKPELTALLSPATPETKQQRTASMVYFIDP